MKSIMHLVVTFLFLSIYMAAGNLLCAPPSDVPEKVYSIVYIQKPEDWYLKQQKLWKQEIEKNPYDADAWRNYYYAVRYHQFAETSGTREKKDRLNSIVEEMKKYVPDSYQYYYIRHKTEGSLKDASALMKAYEIRPDEPEIYSDLVAYYEFQGQPEKVMEFMQKWYRSQDVAPGLLDYNYNVLATTSKNAVLFTNGDNDTYPVWMLQQIQNIRKDVTVLNASLIRADKKYLERKCAEKGIQLNFQQLPENSSSEFVTALAGYIHSNYPEIPVYLALTMFPDYIDPVKDKLYIVGLAYQYSDERLDNTALVRKNLEKYFRMDYLDHSWYSGNYLASGIVDRLNMNYIAPMVILAEHYQKCELTEAARHWAVKALKLAEKGGMKERLEKDLKNKGFSF